MTLGQWVKRKHLAVAVTVVLALLLGSVVGLILHQSMLAAKRGAAQSIAFGHAQRITQRLQEAVAPTYMLASLVLREGGRVDNFDSIGQELLQDFPMARAVELAPGGVVRQVYPLVGNESIIGHDLLKDRDRNREAHLALATRQLTVAGPFALIQGGVGVVARYPVFFPDREGRSAFWGFTIVLVRVPELLNAAGMTDLAREGYRYELCRVPLNNGQCVAFAHNGEERMDNPVSVPVDVPNGHWQLAVVPEEGWVTDTEKFLLALAVIAVALLLGGLQYLFLRYLQRSLEPGA